MSSVIRLLDSSGSKLLDCVSGEYEDTFTLESFEELVESYKEVGPGPTGLPRSFIIARVQTWDANQPDREFYSYYCAHQLNKVIIKVQKYLDKKLIHRLHVLNPLTNTDIIGNIQYFRVDASTEKNWKKDEKSTSDELDLKEENKDIKVKKENVDSDDKQKKPKLTIKTNKALINKKTLDIQPTTPSVKEIESGNKASWTMAGPTVMEIEGDDAKASKSNSKPPKSPWKSIMTPIGKGKTIDKSSSVTSQPPPISPMSPTSGKGLDSAKAPQTPHSRVNIPAGTVTQFTLPVSQDNVKDKLPLTAKNRRRALSYSNTVQKLGNNTTVDEWINIVEVEKEVYKVTPFKSPNLPKLNELDDEGNEKQYENVTEDIPAEGNMYDEIHPIASPVKRDISPLGESSKQANTSVSELKLLDSDSHSKPFGGNVDITKAIGSSGQAILKSWDAYLFATDIDFLESSEIRLLFRLNALSPEDAKLFELPPVVKEDIQEENDFENIEISDNNNTRETNARNSSLFCCF